MSLFIVTNLINEVKAKNISGNIKHVSDTKVSFLESN
jgi:hypothetical protein